MADENKFSLIDLPDIPDSVDNALKNLTDSPTQNAGQTFGDIWYLVFGGISYAADKKRMKYAHDLETYRQELDQAIKSIPEEKLIEPSIQTTAQALENSKYCISSEKLRNMFVNLISRTMNSDTEPHVHPSFPEIIKQMSEYDALFMQAMKQHQTIPIVTLGMQSSNGTLYNQVANICSIPDLKLSQEQYRVSISSLIRAGLLETTYSEWYANESLYDSFKETSDYSSIYNLSKVKGMSVNIQKGICRLTALGSEFVISCIE